jgi:transcriptional regulator with XRE-family HTH domain
VTGGVRAGLALVVVNAIVPFIEPAERHRAQEHVPGPAGERLDLGLLQREVAQRLGVVPGTLTNWELNRTKPTLRFLPGIINLLGSDPSAPGASLGERLKAWRHRAGVPQDRFARLIGIDPGTLSRWERNLRVPAGRYARLVEVFPGP